MKRLFDIKYNGQEYDAVGRRKGQDLFYILGGNKVAPGGASAGPTAMNKAPSKIAPSKSTTMQSAPKAAIGTTSKTGAAAIKSKVPDSDASKL